MLRIVQAKLLLVVIEVVVLVVVEYYERFKATVKTYVIEVDFNQLLLEASESLFLLR